MNGAGSISEEDRMIKQMPNVEASKMPRKAEFAGAYSLRYKCRLDGSSLWEARRPGADWAGTAMSTHNEKCSKPQAYKPQRPSRDRGFGEA